MLRFGRLFRNRTRGVADLFVARRYVADHDRPGTGDRAVADRDRRDQRIVRPDEDVGADLGAVLLHAVVVAGDRAGAVVGARTDARIADVGQVIRLDVVGELRLLDLDEISDAHAIADHVSVAEVRERSDADIVADARRDHDALTYLAARADRRVG